VWIYTQSNKTNIDNMHQGYDPKVNTNVKKLALLFAIQHLLHHSIVYNIYAHYCTIKMDAFIIAFLSSYLRTVQYSTVQYSTVQYSTVQYSTVQYSTVQCSTVQCSTVQCSAAQHSTIQYSTVQYSVVQYSTGNILSVC
jgi:hypothetical protein